MPFTDPIVAGSTLVRQAIKSPNYVAGTAGWIVDRDGSAEFSDAVVRGTFEAGGGTVVVTSAGVLITVGSTAIAVNSTGFAIDTTGTDVSVTSSGLTIDTAGTDVSVTSSGLVIDAGATDVLVNSTGFSFTNGSVTVTANSTGFHVVSGATTVEITASQFRVTNGTTTYTISASGATFTSGSTTVSTNATGFHVVTGATTVESTTTGFRVTNGSVTFTVNVADGFKVVNGTMTSSLTATGMVMTNTSTNGTAFMDPDNISLSNSFDDTSLSLDSNSLYITDSASPAHVVEFVASAGYGALNFVPIPTNQRGRSTISSAAATSATTAVSFSQPFHASDPIPIVYCNAVVSPGTAGAIPRLWVMRPVNISRSGFTILTYSTDASVATFTNQTVDWVAIGGALTG